MKVEEIITNQILDYLKEGQIPWKQPWLNIFPQNFASKREYSGINFFLLSIITQEKHYRFPYYLTYKQATDLGGKVKYDELKNGNMVVFSKTFGTKKKKGEDEEDDEKKKGYFWVLRYYRVFNVDQCEGIEVKEEVKNEKNVDYEDILTLYKDKPEIDFGGNRAYYSPSLDKVGLPSLNQFANPLDYYATMYHELTHSTGSMKRLKRFKSDENSIFGSETYSKEELVAELGSAFLCARHNIDNRLVKNSAGYIQNWLKALKNNPRWIISASSKAQKATDYMRGVKAKSYE